MTPDRNQRLFELFAEICDLPREERDTRLDIATRGDPALRQEVESLLSSDRSALPEFESSLLGPAVRERCVDAVRDLADGASSQDTPISSDPTTPDNGAPQDLPTQLGRYRITSVIGQGSMGVVLEGEQEAPRRSVAIKLLGAAMPSDRLRHRFAIEAQALALLRHPNIAQIYEADTYTSAFGPRPYFVMELVGGTTLTAYAQSHRPDRKARLDLLAILCDAVHHAHQRGVIHRDLKPGNILIAAGGQPKIVDFGIARIAESESGALDTRSGEVLGTLSYMSPEQARGDAEEIDARSDVYALGVIGYELLTGHLPYDLDGQSLPQSIKTIETALPAHDAGLGGEVETIIGTALAKDADQRYASAAAVAGDVRRYLRHEPIHAHPPSGIYVLKKFARRHTGWVAGIAISILLLIGGTIGTTQGWLAARRAQREAEDRTELLTTILAGGDVEALGRNAEFREVLDIASRTLENSEPSAAIGRVRLVIGKSYRQLTEYAAAQAELDRAYALLRDELGERHLETLTCQVEIAWLCNNSGEFERAKQLASDALDGLRATIGDDNEPGIDAMTVLGKLDYQQARYAEAIARFDHVLELQIPRLGPEHTRTLTTRLYRTLAAAEVDSVAGALREIEELAGIVDSLPEPNDPLRVNLVAARAALYTRMGDFATAERLQLEAIRELTERRGAQHHFTLNMKANLAISYLNRHDLDAAERVQLDELASSRAMLGDEHPDVLNSMHVLGCIYNEQKRFADARPLLQRTLQLRREHLGIEHPRIESTLMALVTAYERGGDDGRTHPDLAAASHVLEESITAWRDAIGPDAPRMLRARGRLAAIRFAAGDAERAAAILEETLLAQRRVVGDFDPSTLRTQHNLATIYSRLGRYERASELMRATYDGRKRTLGSSDRATLGTLDNLVSLALRAEHYDEALRYADEKIATLVEEYGDNDPKTVTAKLTRARARIEAGDLLGGEAETRALREFAEREHGSDSPTTLIARIALGAALNRLERYRDAFAELQIDWNTVAKAPGKETVTMGYRECGIALTGLERYSEAERELITAFERRGGRLSETREALVRLYEKWGRETDAGRYR